MNPKSANKEFRNNYDILGVDTIGCNFEDYKKRFEYVIEFDGGTSCNNPSKGYGVGYGSYLIEQKDIGVVSKAQRQTWDGRHSCNSAELTTLLSALESLVNVVRERENITKNLLSDGVIPDSFTFAPSILVCGDSQIALKWLNCKLQPKVNTYIGFRTAIYNIKRLVNQYQDSFHIGELIPYWRGRKKSVELFGH
jgi:hypothetical protein